MFITYLEPYQTLDEFLQLLLCLPHCFFSANHSDELLVFVLCSGEDDPGTGAVTNLADVSTTFPNEELVVFWLCTQLSSVALCLLKKNIYKLNSTTRYYNSTSIIRLAQKML